MGPYTHSETNTDYILSTNQTITITAALVDTTLIYIQDSGVTHTLLPDGNVSEKIQKLKRIRL